MTLEAKYPKSKNNFQCVGPCFQPNTLIVHPLTLEYVTDRYYPFCPVREWSYIDNETGDKIMKTTDICLNPTESKDLSGKEFEINMLTPTVDFNDEQFLKIFYNIYSFDDAVTWIDNKTYTSPLLTRYRVMNSAWNAYGSEIDIIDYRIVKFYIELAKKRWSSDIYKHLHKYVHILGQDVLLGDPDKNDLSYKDNAVIRINFLIDRFINNDEMYKFLVKYLKHRKDEWENTIDHSDSIKNDLIKYIENKIKLTVGEK
jgi:hypothetical protein